MIVLCLIKVINMKATNGAIQARTAKDEERQKQINEEIRQRIKKINSNDELTQRVIDDIIYVLNRYEDTHSLNIPVDGWVNNIYGDVIYQLVWVDADASEKINGDVVVLLDGAHIIYNEEQQMWVVEE
jgi:hypothetical protein